MDYFQSSVGILSTSAFSQQQNTLHQETFQFLFYEFNSLFPFQKVYSGYQLLTCNGSELIIARNLKDMDTYFQFFPTDKRFNQIHLNTLYVLCEKRYADVVVQPVRKENQSAAMIKRIVHRLGQKKTIFIGDRGYETYNILRISRKKGCII